MATGYAATGSYLDKDVSKQDKNAIAAIAQQYETAKSKGAQQSYLDSLHQQAESIRKEYGYAGGTDGSEYWKLETQEPVKSGIAAGTSQADYISSLYKAQQDTALSKLKAAYEQNMIDLNAAGAKIPETYQAARNQTAAAAEQKRAAFNEQAAAHGLNSGAGGQASLAMANQNAANMSAINSQEANAVTDLETTRLKHSTAYQNDIAQAIAQGDLARAQVLYKEAARVDDSLVQQSMAQADENYRHWSTGNAKQQKAAETLAKYGDFSGFLALGYTQEQVNQMQRVWGVQNPYL